MIDFSIDGQVAVVTGGTGVLCRVMCHALIEAGANVAILGLRCEPAEALANELGGAALGLGCDVLDEMGLDAAATRVIDRFGRVDILINGAGGNRPQTTTSPQRTFFDLSADDLRWVLDLNLMGTILSSQAFGRIMSEQKRGVILNIVSMSAFRPLTRVPAYWAAKAGVSNLPNGWRSTWPRNVARKSVSTLLLLDF